MDHVLTPCFHCGEPCPPGLNLTILKRGQELPVCCEGCAAVASLIMHSGLDRYYQFREGQARKADEDMDALGAAWQSCDERRELWGEALDNQNFDLLLQTEGVQCAACAWPSRNW